MSAGAQSDDDEGCGCCGIWTKKKTVQKSSGRKEASPGAKTTELGLSTREQEQVLKALQAEVERRRRWRTLLKGKALKKAASGAPSIEDILAGPPPPEAPESTSVSARDAEKELDTDGKLNEKKRQWIKTMQNAPDAKKSKKKKKKADEQPIEQPQSLTIEDDQAKEMGSHGLMDMVKKVLTKEQEEEAKLKKSFGDMEPDELIKLRRNNPEAWEKLVNTNSVASFGLSKPTPADEQRAKHLLEKAKKGGSRRPQHRKQQISFEERITVAGIRAGEDFDPNESVRVHSAKLNVQSPPLKKQQ